MKLIYLLVLLTACAHKLQNEHVVTSMSDPEKVCLKPVDELRTNSYYLKSNIEKTAGTTVSLLATGLAYTGDLVYIVGTYGTTGLLCSGMGKTSGNQQCFEAFWGAIPMSNLGGKTFAKTKNLRCPEIIHEAQVLREVSDCYREKGYLVEAEAQFRIIENSLIFRDCVR